VAQPGVGHLLMRVERHQDGLTSRGSQWKLDNSMRSHYARLLMATTPDLHGFFETRQLRSDWDSA
jgi:hypothetical protein